MKNYKDLDIYKLSFDLSVRIRNKTLELPNLDKYEVGSQLRRSSQSIKDNIVEGYGRKRYKSDFIKFLVYSHASLLESTTQCEFLHSIYPPCGWDNISKELDNLRGKIYRFIEYVDNQWETGR